MSDIKQARRFISDALKNVESIPVWLGMSSGFSDYSIVPADSATGLHTYAGFSHRSGLLSLLGIEYL